MYIATLEGETEKTLDLPGVYRLVAMANPADGHPMTLDSRAIVAQLTRPRGESSCRRARSTPCACWCGAP